MTLKTEGLQTLEQVRDFLAGSAPLDFAVVQRPAAYGFVAAQLGRFDFRRLGKADKGLVRRYLCKVAGLSRAQMTRLIAQHAATGRIEDHRGPPAQPFARRYTAEDVRLLAKPAPVLRHGVDALHGTLSGPATRSRVCDDLCDDHGGKATRQQVAGGLATVRARCVGQTADAPTWRRSRENAICIVRRLPVLSVTAGWTARFTPLAGWKFGAFVPACCPYSTPLWFCKTQPLSASPSARFCLSGRSDKVGPSHSVQFVAADMFGDTERPCINHNHRGLVMIRAATPLLVALALAGCATSNPRPYQSQVTDSEALSVMQAGGFRGLEDAELPEGAVAPAEGGPTLLGGLVRYRDARAAPSWFFHNLASFRHSAEAQRCDGTAALPQRFRFLAIEVSHTMGRESPTSPEVQIPSAGRVAEHEVPERPEAAAVSSHFETSALLDATLVRQIPVHELTELGLPARQRKPGDRRAAMPSHRPPTARSSVRSAWLRLANASCWTRAPCTRTPCPPTKSSPVSPLRPAG